MPRKDENTYASTNSSCKELATSSRSLSTGSTVLDTQLGQKANRLEVPVVKTCAQQLSADTDMQSREQHTHHSLDTNGVKDVNLCKLSCYIATVFYNM